MACGVDTENAKKDRRSLKSEATKHIVPVLSETVESVWPGLTVDWEGYVCRSCFRDMEKYIKLKREVTNRVRAVRCYRQLSASNQENELPQPGGLGQRKHDDAEVAAPVKKPRLAASTGPLSLGPGPSASSPDVMVSYNYTKREINTEYLYFTGHIVFQENATLRLDSNSKKTCKPIARRSSCALARQCLKDEAVRRYIVKGIGLIIRHEVATLCSNKVVSVLGGKTKKWRDSSGEL